MGCTNNHSPENTCEFEEGIRKFEESLLFNESFGDVIASLAIKTTLDGDELKFDRALRLLGSDKRPFLKIILEHEFFHYLKLKNRKSLFVKKLVSSQINQEERKIDFYKIKLLIFLLLPANNEIYDSNITINHKAEYFYSIAKDVYKGNIFNNQETIESIQRFHIHFCDVLEDLIDLSCIVLPKIYRQTDFKEDIEIEYFNSLEMNKKLIYNKMVDQIFNDKEEIQLKDVYKLFENNENVFIIINLVSQI
jgi:hypothetical protein